MPEQIKSSSKPDREVVDTYHKALYHIVEIVRSWDRSNLELQEFLDFDNDSMPEPEEFSRFREAWELAIAKGRKAKVFHRALRRHQALKTIAKELWCSEARMKFYAELLNGKLRCASADVKPISAVNLERRYQYYLYKKGREYQGLEDPVPNFGVWCHTPNCVTFYDILFV